ncbi:MAG: sigma-70 family RNA polymerase sigma factor [Bacteroidetes bacterium]|nr:sigma-70 family RNA polymerase sigma factor [Bacteroidota bacterium]MBS1648901.1 sigma-70 family RNA polymerase sigma factor [Bacteroidota bacterium]
MNAGITLDSQMANGQKNTITQIVNHYSKRLLGFIRKRVNNDADAEDILQDVFYQFIGNTQPIEQLTSWLFTVARNKIIDRSRKHKPDLLEDIFTNNEEEDFSWTDLFFAKDNNPETEYLRNLFWETLNTALNELPEEQRNVFIQNELEGISFKDIATQTGETINTLLSRKRYAVLHLRKRLQTLKTELLNY